MTSALVELVLHSPSDRLVTVDLDRLSPRARALAEVCAATILHGRPAVMLESSRTIREMDPTAADLLWYGEDALDRPHRVVWEHWSHYPPDSTVDPHDYLEGQAQSLPIGYYPIGVDAFIRVPSADAARDDTEYITRHQVLELLRDLGRPLSAATLDNYRSKPPGGWPQPARYVGRTPLWRRSEVEAYAKPT